MSTGFLHYPKSRTVVEVVLQEDMLQEVVHLEVVPPEEGYIPTPKHREGEVMAAKTAGEMTVVVTPGRDTSNRIQTGVNTRDMTGSRNPQGPVGPQDQPATQEETER